MQWHNHSNIVGKHAVFGASNYHWTNKSIEEIGQQFTNEEAKTLGTRIHAVCAELIFLNMRLDPMSRPNEAPYVNDAIGFKMTPEQPLYYSEFFFGTADAIRYDDRKKFLRIHDLKTGTSRTSMRQLEIYMALFCLEYRKKPHDISAELRIYQNGEVVIHEPDPDYIKELMELIVNADKYLQRMKGN